MLKLDPNIAFRILADVKPGSLIRLGRWIGFCGTHPRDPAGTHFMVFHDAETGTFKYRVTPVSVWDFGEDLVIRPNLESTSDDVLPSEATTELFLDQGSKPAITVHLESGDSRFFDLNAGTTGQVPRGQTLTAFKEWTVGVQTLAGDYLPLLVIGTRFGAMFDHDGPTEPEQT